MKLTTTRFFLIALPLSLLAIIGSLILLHEREPPEDPRAPPTGPSSVIRGIRQRAAAREKRAREAERRELEAIFRGDGGVTSDPGE